MAYGRGVQMKFWIIKTRQSISDISEWSRKGPTHQWFGRRLPRNWSRGDLLFIWAAAPRLQVFRVAELAVPDDGEEAGDSHFRIRYLSDVFEGPSIAFLRRNRIFRDASFLKVGPAGTVFPLTERQGMALSTMVSGFVQLPHLPKITTDDDAMTRQTLGAGFGSPKENKRVEEAAVRVATEYLEHKGWKVRSVEVEKRGYDLHCERNVEVLRVEVKGVRGTKPCFMLTAQEYRISQKETACAICVVTSALRKPKVLIVTHTQLKKRLRVEPLVFKAVISK